MSNTQCLANHDKKKIEKNKELIKNTSDSHNSDNSDIWTPSFESLTTEEKK